MNDEAQVPKNQVASVIGVEVAEGGNGAPAPSQICKVDMGHGDSEGSKVDCRGV